MSQEFLKPRLVGTRFNEHSVPLELLKDFAALEEMIIEVAKWKFLQAHPDRARVPRGFTDGVALHLTKIEDGSAVPVISLLFGTPFPSVNSTYFDQAREAIIEAVASANQGQDSTSQLPPNLLGYFDRFGRSLREGESMEFIAANQQVASLTTESRRKLIRASLAFEWTEEVSLLTELQDGWLDGKGYAPERSALDWLARSFEVNFDPDLPLPYLYPTAEGGVQAEWSAGTWEVTLDIDLLKQTAEYQALHLTTQACNECVLDLSQQGAWQQLNESLNKLRLEVA